MGHIISQRRSCLRQRTPAQKGKPVTYAAYPGELPVIRVVKRIIPEWKPYRAESWSAHCRNLRTRGFFYAVVSHSKRQTRASIRILIRAGRCQRLHQSWRSRQWPHQEIYFDPRTFSKKRWATRRTEVVHSFARLLGNVQWQLKESTIANALALGTGGHQLNEIYQKADATSEVRSQVFRGNLL